MKAVSNATQGGWGAVTAVISSSSVIRPPAPSRCYNGCSPVTHIAPVGASATPQEAATWGTPPAPPVAKDLSSHPKLYDTSTAFVDSTGFVDSSGFFDSIACVYCVGI